MSSDQRVKVLLCVYSIHELSSWFHQSRNQVIPFKTQVSLKSNPRSWLNSVVVLVFIFSPVVLIANIRCSSLMFNHHLIRQFIISITLTLRTWDLTWDLFVTWKEWLGSCVHVWNKHMAGLLLFGPWTLHLCLKQASSNVDHSCRV